MIGLNWSQRIEPTAIADWLREFRGTRARKRALADLQPIVYRGHGSEFHKVIALPEIKRSRNKRAPFDVFANAREPVAVLSKRKSAPRPTPISAMRAELSGDPSYAVSRSRRAEVRRGRWGGRLVLRAKVIEWLQNGLCYLCGGAMNPSSDKTFPSLEHVMPVIRGGGNRGNVLMACSPCNSAKDDRLPKPCEVLFLEFINELV